MTAGHDGVQRSRGRRRDSADAAGETFTVLVVCTGNVNRSALGAVLLDTWSGWYLPSAMRDQVRIGSAGLRAPAGSSMGPRAQVIAEALGADGSRHRAVQITDETIRAADLVLVSSARQRESVLGLVPGALRSTFTIREAGRIAEYLAELPTPASPEEMRRVVAALAENRTVDDADDGEDDIVDPQGKDDESYRIMARQEVPPLASLAGVLFGMPAAEIAAYGEAAQAAAFDFTGGGGVAPESSPGSGGRHRA